MIIDRLKIWFGTRWKTRRAETLIEVIIAIFVVATGSAAATSLIVTAVQSNSFSRDNLIALNLAVEGVEAVRNVRDSNWLRFAYDKENCWNMDPQIDICQDSNLIQAGFYRVDLDVSKMRWLLTAVPSQLNLKDNSVVDANDKNYQLKYVDLDGSGTDHDLYFSGTPANPAVSSGDSKFFRMVSIKYSGSSPVDSDEMLVTSMVQWPSQSGANQVFVMTKLTNYQK